MIYLINANYNIDINIVICMSTLEIIRKRIK